MRLWDTYSDSFERFRSTRAQLRVATESRQFGESGVMRADAKAPPAESYRIQQDLRPLFGKAGLREPAFGDHPDFRHLRGSADQAYGAVTTMFMDIEGSTRLGVLYSPQQVFQIKNAIIRCAIETIQAFDGHVHRIMGDAVMAYFRDGGRAGEDSAIDALNCASLLVEFVEQVVLPQLKQDGADHEFGIRVGLDYGAEPHVLWASYGYPGMEEVTATSFHVDAAAKLQQAAKRNSVMLGAGLRDYLDLPEQVHQIKTTVKDGVAVPRPYLRPNYTGSDGEPINYGQFELRQTAYFKLLPVTGLSLGNGTPIHVTATVHRQRDEDVLYTLSRCGRAVAKEAGIRFAVSLSYTPSLPAEVIFRVENHGREATDRAGANRGNHHTVKPLRKQSDGSYGTVHWEDTEYRGLHFLWISVRNAQGRTTPEACFAVFVT